MKVKEFLKILGNQTIAKIVVWKDMGLDDPIKTEYRAHKIYHSCGSYTVSVHLNNTTDINNLVTTEAMLEMEIDSKSEIAIDHESFLKIELRVTGETIK